MSVPPLVVGSVLDETPGVHHSQLVQTGPRSVLLRLDVKSDVPKEQVWEDAISNLVEYIAAQELTDIQIARAAVAPESSPTSGKHRQGITARRAHSKPIGARGPSPQHPSTAAPTSQPSG